MIFLNENSLPQGFLEEFENPGKEYRGTPFWSWNTKLDKESLDWQIEQFREMGMGGFYIHTRVGLDTEYMGPVYMECVKKAAEIAREKDLYCCLYDEDRWPSGYGGGRVTKHQKYRNRNLLITPCRKGTKTYEYRNADSMASPSPQGNGRFLAAYKVELNPDGTLRSYERCGEESAAEKNAGIWYVYLETAHDSPWFNGQSYVDTLNPEAVRYFLEVTHEKYRQAVGEAFGKTIPAIFTDEPQFGKKGCLGNAGAMEEVMLPYTEDFAETYQSTYGEDLLDHIPELLWELPGEAVSKYRYWYHDHLTERFAEAYSDQIGAWCGRNGIRLAGHMMEEPSLQSQTQALGEVMRSLRGFHLPGIDMLCDAREYTTAKQAESVSRQYGREGVVSELYGVTNWDFDFRRHKLQGDWQAALGVTHRVHHLSWMSMGGEAKRDYPAAIGFQSPWYREYRIIENHFARVNTAMRRGNAVVRIGVIHPIESFWLLFGPNQQTGQKRQELDQRFRDVTEWLLFHQLDFDYIAESLLPQQWNDGKVGRMEYDAVVVPGCLTLRRTTLDILKKMRDGGKKIIFMGKAPACMDACACGDIRTFAQNCIQIEFAKSKLLKELEEFRLLDIRYDGDKHLKKPNHKKNWNGERAEKYLYQMRREGERRWLFVANGTKEESPDLALPDDVRIELDGAWNVTELDTMEGTVKRKQASVEHNKTVLYHRFYGHDSLLLHLEPLREGCVSKKAAVESSFAALHAAEAGRASKESSGELFLTAPICTAEAGCASPDLRQAFVQAHFGYALCQERLADPVEIQLEEPNVLLLDMPMYRFGDENPHFEGPEEILRIDNKLREKRNLPLRRAALAQPWTRPNPTAAYPVALRYILSCETEIDHVSLALEALEATELFLDGKRINTDTDSGFYVDSCISSVKLPVLLRGRHELELRIAFSEKVNLECCYLLGDFQVGVYGSRTVLRKRRGAPCWGSLTEQGMPFYGGNAVYAAEAELEPGEYLLEVSKYRAPLLEVRIDGEKAGNIITAPYTLPFEIGQPGIHRIGIKSFGSRVNTFGAVHNCDESEVYFDPNAWRTTGESWSYEYQLKKTGILKAPMLWKKV